MTTDKCLHQKYKTNYKFDEPNIKEMTNEELYEYLTILNILRTRAEIERDNRLVEIRLRLKK